MSIDSFNTKINSLSNELEQDLVYASPWDSEKASLLHSKVSNLMQEVFSLKGEAPQSEIDKAYQKLTTMQNKIKELSTSVLSVGNFSFRKIPYDALQPGDIICTYESTSTVPSIIEVTKFQKMIASSDKKDLYKMLHFEVVLKKHPRAGMYDIAHASGLKKEVIKDTENFKNYPPGQSIVVFRPKSEALREKIIDVCKKTCDKGNPWKIQLQSVKDKWRSKIYWIFKSWVFERKGKKDKNIKKIKQSVTEIVNLSKGKGFLDQNGKDLKSLNCAEYAAGVVNCALIGISFEQILKNKELSDEEKIDVISETLSHVNSKEGIYTPPIEYNTPEVSAAGFVRFFLSHPDDWEPVGYIGTHHDVWKEEDLHLERLGNQLEFESQLDGLKDICDVEEKTILKAFRALDMVNSNNYFKLTSSNQSEKRKAAFAYLYADKLHMDSKSITEFILDWKRKDVIDSLNNFENDFIENKKNKRLLTRKKFIKDLAKEKKVSVAFVKKYLKPKNRDRYEVVKAEYERFDREIDSLIQKPDKITYPDPKSKVVIPEGLNLNFTESKKILLIERKLIKESSGDSQTFVNEKIKKISLNYIHFNQIKARKRKRLARRLIIAGILTLPVLPLGLILFAIGAGMRKSANRINEVNTQWENRINKVYEEALPNTMLRLKSDVGYGNRPWVHYMTDGKTWETEPLWLTNLRDHIWEVKINFPEKKTLEYKYFIGPDDPDSVNPLEQVKQWMTGDNIIVPKDYFRFRQGLREAPTVEYPTWG